MKLLRFTTGCLLVGSLLYAGGCSRTRYRLQADQHVTELVNEKSNDPRWALPNLTLRMDPRSRYFDPFNPDREPMPPDDPTANTYMRRVYGMRGYKHWYDNGVVPDLQNPGWRENLVQYVGFTDDDSIKLDLEGSVGLALIHSADYRTQLETIYLSALDVSTERFRFTTQFYGGFGPNFTHIGARENGGTESNTLTLTTNPTPTATGVNVGNTPSRLQFQRQFATGGQLLTTFANSFVWQFTGDGSTSNLSLLNFNLVQPLLRGAGRAVALEQLTIVERTLLCNLRAMQRYRQGFFTNIAIGDVQGITGPQRKGGFSGGTGLTGFTGQGAGGLGGVGAATNFGRQGFGGVQGGGGAGAAGAGFAGGGAGTIGGFVGLLQQLQQIRNTQNSLDLQLQTLALLEANLEAGLIDITQVDVFRQNIETERANLLAAQVNLENSMDTFKRQILYLPPDLAINLDDSMIRQFRLIDPKTREAVFDIAAFIDRLGKTEKNPSIEFLNKAFDEFAALRPPVGERFDEIEADLQGLDQATEAREKLLAPEEKPVFAAEKKKLAEQMAQLKERFLAGQEEMERIRAGLNEETRGKTADALVALAGSLSTLTQELSLVQARARLETVTIEPIELDSRQALEIARANRMDWMNNRVTVTDTWRLITFNANALKSNLTVTFSGNLATDGNTAFAFNGANGDLSTGVRFDPPFTRLLERNNYRQSLINYQQDRRTLIQFEDSINQTLRQDLRTLNQLKTNLEIQRRAVAIAIRRVDKTLEDLNKPPAPVQPGQPAEQLGPTAALNLLTAISDLRNAQNNFMSVWLNYYSERMQLMRDLGVMQIDERGMWIDQPLDAVLAQIGMPCPPIPPEVPEEWLRDVGIDPNHPEATETLPIAPKELVPGDAKPMPPEMLPVPGPKPNSPKPRDTNDSGREEVPANPVEGKATAHEEPLEDKKPSTGFRIWFGRLGWR
jgi:hypothetical protein